MKKLKILAHYGDWAYTPQRKAENTFGAIGYYRIVMPAKQIEGHDVDIMGNEILKFGKTVEEQWDNIFKEYDVFWTNYFSHEPTFVVMYYYAEKHGKKIILDIDDNYLDVPKTNKLYEKYRPQKRERAMLSTILSFAHAITCSTFPLKEKIWNHISFMHKIDKPIFVIPNMNDVNFWKTKNKPKFEKDIVTIGYAGSNSHRDDLQMIMPIMSKLMTKYGNLHFRLLGSVEKSLIPEYFKGFSKDAMNRLWVGSTESIFKDYPGWLGQQSWDIGIAPLVDTPFTRCKSHIKIMEYAMFKIPVVASRVYPYFMPIRNKAVSKDNETVLLARSNEWEQKLTQLIEYPELRKKLGQNSYEFYRKEWQYKNSELPTVLQQMFTKLF